MTIKVHLESGEISDQQADITEFLLPIEEKEETKNFSGKISRSSNCKEEGGGGGSISTVLLSTFVVVLGSLEFGYATAKGVPELLCSGLFFSHSVRNDRGPRPYFVSVFYFWFLADHRCDDWCNNQRPYCRFHGSKRDRGFASLYEISASLFSTEYHRALRVASASYITGWLLIIITKVALPLDIGRLFVGYGVGLTSYTVPIYIAEIAPKTLRGALTNTNQLSITIGILIVYLLGVLVGWRLLAVMGIIPCALLLVGLFFIPESPRWLAKVGREKEFQVALQTLRGKDCDVTAEAAEVQECVEELESLPKAGILDLFQRKYAHHMIVGVGLMVFQQLAGINALMFYASTIFKAAGFNSDHLASVSIAALQVPMTIVGVLLMDRSGRRPLLMVAAGGMTIGCSMVGLSFYIQGHESYTYLSTLASILAIGGLLVYIATFSLGMGGIPWIIMSEIFPLNMKGIAGSLVTLVSWFGSWVITLTFNFLLTWSASGSFFIFAGASASAVLFVAKLLPETKGQTLEEIQASFETFFTKRTSKSYEVLC